ncbi:hypothetical protein [Planctomicrobium piriforme]|uniref:Lipoprotein n=1 Tax=Planctomicrobium piriforme TaxID=1576369 RepID=A0A1I3FBH2_9PLAN|nr:hypothetical protein [Planctomicrobium piriforme]SFI08578.1 hypothetical protein SAMN05421753_105165 [Planctomicrobium piriforme]
MRTLFTLSLLVLVACKASLSLGEDSPIVAKVVLQSPASAIAEVNKELAGYAPAGEYRSRRMFYLRFEVDESFDLAGAKYPPGVTPPIYLKAKGNAPGEPELSVVLYGAAAKSIRERGGDLKTQFKSRFVQVSGFISVRPTAAWGSRRSCYVFVDPLEQLHVESL